MLPNATTGRAEESSVVDRVGEGQKVRPAGGTRQRRAVRNDPRQVRPAVQHVRIATGRRRSATPRRTVDDPTVVPTRCTQQPQPRERGRGGAGRDAPPRSTSRMLSASTAATAQRPRWRLGDPEGALERRRPDARRPPSDRDAASPVHDSVGRPITIESSVERAYTGSPAVSESPRLIRSRAACERAHRGKRQAVCGPACDGARCRAARAVRGLPDRWLWITTPEGPTAPAALTGPPQPAGRLALETREATSLRRLARSVRFKWFAANAAATVSPRRHAPASSAMPVASALANAATRSCSR
jgi:hypothetical protein